MRIPPRWNLNRQQQRRYQSWLNDRRQDYWAHRHDRLFLLAEQRRLRALRERYHQWTYYEDDIIYVVPYGEPEVVFIQNYEQVDPLLMMISALLVVLMNG